MTAAAPGCPGHSCGLWGSADSHTINQVQTADIVLASESLKTHTQPACPNEGARVLGPSQRARSDPNESLALDTSSLKPETRHTSILQYTPLRPLSYTPKPSCFLSTTTKTITQHLHSDEARSKLLGRTRMPGSQCLQYEVSGPGQG